MASRVLFSASLPQVVGTPQQADSAAYRSLMCGRFTHRYRWKQLHRLLQLTSPPQEFPARYNVAPSQQAPVVRSAPGGWRRIDLLRWGLIPPWATDAKIGYSTINARADSVATKPAFRSAFKSQRCLIPVSGFYEWKAVEGSTVKQPYLLTSTDEEPLMLGGLWESWRDSTAAPDAPPVESFTIITTEANELMATIHDRMPVILQAEDWARWLDPNTTAKDELLTMLKPYPSELMMATPVSTRVNSPKNDDEACIRPIAIDRGLPWS